MANVPYHFRLVASNALGVVYGFDQILDEANVVVWGANYVGQANVPPGLSNVVAIAGAYDHSLALKNNGTAVGWGDNTFGQATVPAGLNNLVAVAGGEYYSLALKNNGTVAAWGANILWPDERAGRFEQCGDDCQWNLFKSGIEKRWNGGGLGRQLL